MKYLLLIFITVRIVFAQPEIAIINDADGYTNIREGKGITYPTKNKLYEGEFFFFFPDTIESWIKVSKMWNIEGYVHKSRILPLKELSADKKKTLITDVLKKEKNSQESPSIPLK